jgi:hypothetical protein
MAAWLRTSRRGSWEWKRRSRTTSAKDTAGFYRPRGRKRAPAERGSEAPSLMEVAELGRNERLRNGEGRGKGHADAVVGRGKAERCLPPVGRRVGGMHGGRRRLGQQAPGEPTW